MTRANTKPRLGPEGKHFSGPMATTVALIGRIALLLAEGKKLSEAAAAVDVKVSHVRDWQLRHRELWTAAEKRAAASIAALIRVMANTDRILESPAAFVRMAELAERHLKAEGEQLFPSAGHLTLCTFYEVHYRPRCLADAADETKLNYVSTLKRWRLLTGDPPLDKINTETLTRFRDALCMMPGKREGSLMSKNSVRSRMRAIQTLLDKAGPPGRENRDAFGLIATVPWAKPPRPEIGMPRIVEADALGDVYAAAVAMERPRVAGFKPPAWWRALLVVAYNTGLRRTTLFRLRMDEIEWDKNRLVIYPKRMKSRRPHVVHLNATAIDHLRAIRTDRELVFPWPHHLRHFHTLFHRLQTEAGIPKEEHFGLHAIRKTTASILAEESLAAAQYTLGHTASMVTERHYINSSRLTTGPLDRMPQPEAFRTARPRSAPPAAARPAKPSRLAVARPIDGQQLAEVADLADGLQLVTEAAGDRQPAA